LTEHFLLV